ncbi:phosphotransferase [Lentzea tibetensis]|uniref:Phosphotransferase n=1 Tax=Lentzea tibetensis TaxID=2591470 RepID=A0A563ETI0_9PSEU|nr:phosphotransferase [Lentzea tibetensis]TWP50434.1 phosphotransferase [Lentzea tibetensis]
MPVAQKPKALTGFDDRHLHALRVAYGLADVDALLPVIMDGEFASLLDVRTETSRKALLEDELGTWFVKQVPWYADDEAELARRHALTRQLASTGLVPRKRKTVDGLGWTRIEGAAFEVTEYRRGHRFDGSARQVRAAGSALATLHDCPISHDGPAEDYRSLVAKHVRLAEEVGAPPRLRAVLRECEAALPAQLPDDVWHALPQTFVHGDYSPWNVVFGPGDVLAVVDFDNSDVGSRLRDVVEGVLTAAGVRYQGDSTNFARPFRCELDEGLAAAFLAGYLGTTLTPFTEAELSCLRGVVRAVHVELVALAVLRGEIDDESADEVAAWQADPPDLAALVADVRRIGVSP